MSRPLSASLAALVLIVFLHSLTYAQSESRRSLDSPDGARVTDSSHFDQAQTVSSGVISSAKAATDSFYIYGGPGSNEGTFEDSNGAPDWQGWTSSDLSEIYPHWRASTTNAATLGSGAAGNHAVICHQDETAFGGEPYTGYGNSWNDELVLRIDLAALGYDPSQDLVDLRWSFDYVHDVEPNYDYLLVEWNDAGSYQTLLAATGSSFDGGTGIYEPVRFDSGILALSPENYLNGEIRLRLRVTSDGGWSDSDGIYSSGGRGAAAVDDIEVYLDDVLVSYAGWEPVGPKADLPPGEISGHDNGSGTGTAGWQPKPSGFAGDFSKLIFGFEDIDPCRENRGWQYGFIDDGTPANNDPDQRLTSGSVSGTWTYGVPGGYVVNYTGGLSNGEVWLENRIVSPEIDWDLQGSTDDDAWGCVVGWDVWRHLPLSNWIFFTYEMRTWTTADGWSNWFSTGWYWYGSTPAYLQYKYDVTNLLSHQPEKVQLRAGVSHWGPSIDATPSPLFDNFYVKKYVLEGPLLDQGGAFRDHYPADGSLDGSIRLDWSQDVFMGLGDSIIVNISAVNPGTQLADPVHGASMHAALLTNPDFGDHAAGARASALQGLGAVVAGLDARGWPIYTFTVDGQPSTWPDGSPREDTYYFDLPDGPALPDAPHHVDEDPLFFPGDVLHYYLESQDDAGGLSRLPAEIEGFLDFEGMSPYRPGYTVRGLPNGSGTTRPRILFWDDQRYRSKHNRHALAQAGLVEGQDFDYYSGRYLSLGDGLSVEQISQYETILVNESSSDSIDITQLLDWRAQEGKRQIIWFGRN